MSTDDNTVPQLEAYLPDGGAQVGVSDTHDSVALFLDVAADDAIRLHFIELSFAEATNLARALAGAIETIAEHHETVRAAQMYIRLRDEKPALAEEGESRCGVVRPDTLGNQRCLYVWGHSGDTHLSQDGETWEGPGR